MCYFIGHLQTDFVKSDLRASTSITSNQTGEQRGHFRQITRRHHDHFKKKFKIKLS
jgi:hypothetical protein